MIRSDCLDHDKNLLIDGASRSTYMAHDRINGYDHLDEKREGGRRVSKFVKKLI